MGRPVASTYELLDHFVDLFTPDGVLVRAARQRSSWRPDGIDVITACHVLTETDLIDAMFGRMGAPVERGAKYILTAAPDPLRTGAYLQDGEVQQPSKDARDAGTQTALLRHTATALGHTDLDTGRHLSSAQR